jgi:hypothetical protein
MESQTLEIHRRLGDPGRRALPARGRAGGRVPLSGYVMIGMISSATMFATLIIGLIAGPAVSL